jgi:hypothetical protein
MRSWHGGSSTGVKENLPVDKGAIPQDKIFAFFDGEKRGKSLPELVSELLADQQETWPDLADGYESLKTVKDRELSCNGYSVRLRHNPLRARSTMAVVDKESIRKRPCFLCLENLPEGQKGILYRNAYVILCNPMPVFHSHLTIASIDHCPQRIDGNADPFLTVMADLGRAWTVLYNGPECGASAPDHLHFQAIPSGLLPVEEESIAKERLAGIGCIDGVGLYRVSDMGREVFMVKGDNQTALSVAFQRTVSAMGKPRHPGEEPMMNVAGITGRANQRVIIFPRAKHRPEMFFREGDERISVSPAVIEMGGVIVTPVERDFHRLNPDAVGTIYREVSLKTDIRSPIL